MGLNMTQSHDRIPEIALDWHRAGKQAALATVVQTWGSAPRPVGAQLAVSGDAEIMGSVSGGCVEGAVVAEALDALEDGTSRILEFGVSDDDAFAVGLACGGTIRIMVEPLAGAEGPTEELLSQLVDARANRVAVAVATDVTTWSRQIVRYAEQSDAFDADRSGFDSDGKRFLWVSNPPLRLAIVGGVHISQPLADMAALAGYDTTIIDPREAFAIPRKVSGQNAVQ